MVNTDKLRGVIAERGLDQKDVAAMIGKSPKTFYEKMKKRKFDSDEIMIMVSGLGIKNPVEIFFADDVT
jgi:DNA-binding XRE family transcriptional regulator